MLLNDPRHLPLPLVQEHLLPAVALVQELQLADLLLGLELAPFGSAALRVASTLLQRLAHAAADLDRSNQGC